VRPTVVVLVIGLSAPGGSRLKTIAAHITSSAVLKTVPKKS